MFHRFLNGDVGERNKHVVQPAGAGGFCYCAEAAEHKLIYAYVTAQWAVHKHQDLRVQVEFPPRRLVRGC